MLLNWFKKLGQLKQTSFIRNFLLSSFSGKSSEFVGNRCKKTNSVVLLFLCLVRSFCQSLLLATKWVTLFVGQSPVEKKRKTKLSWKLRCSSLFSFSFFVSVDTSRFKLPFFSVTVAWKKFGQKKNTPCFLAFWLYRRN